LNTWPKRSAEILQAVRDSCPMIHHLTNTVVTNLTANVTLCLGGAPVMAPCSREVEEMVSHAGALLLNIGTLDEALVDSMVMAGRKANALDVPVVLDPVGAGATDFRTEAALHILKEVRVAVVRGNAGEVMTLAGIGGRVRGVDSMEGIGDREDAIGELARARELVVAVTGAIDLVTDGARNVKIHNGHPLLARVTGTGCSATTAVATFLAVRPSAPLDAAACALAAFGAAAEIAASRSDGPGTFVPRLLDALASLGPDDISELVRVEELC